MAKAGSIVSLQVISRTRSDRIPTLLEPFPTSTMSNTAAMSKQSDTLPGASASAVAARLQATQLERGLFRAHPIYYTDYSDWAALAYA